VTEALEKYRAARDAVMENPTYEGAMAFWDYNRMGVPIDKDVVLAGVHKARLHWTQATEEQREESRQWLTAHGFSHDVIRRPE
jgi:hypothetical protein